MIWWSEIMVAVSRVCTNGGLRECLYICEVASKSGAWPNNCTHSDKNYMFVNGFPATNFGSCAKQPWNRTQEAT